ncbi:MAG: recombinase family protein [Clostridium sp.]|uniref:recombinase family protein n=1 Tax=Clostridium sp. TaxID=1506 RepID=UPI00290D593A|nr:recombinase family protein [Clostridium sp.]MDU4319796.1 recombinase family protein [Clostridium sp.]
MRIAIYSRKSKETHKGDSINNQIEMCKAYITSFYGEDNSFCIYEDEGFSGGTTNRPQFKKMMKEIKNNSFDILICYRLDRIGRNVSDVSYILEILDQYNTKFISVTEKFDTTTPMGRAMINVASTFAQLERETIAERIKDNMLLLAKKGKWTGGKIPFGFNSSRIIENGKDVPILVTNDSEIKLVKCLYEKYLELGSLHQLEVYATQNNIVNRNGKVFDKTSLKVILQNPIYVKSNKEISNYLTNNGWTVYGEEDNIHSYLSYNKTESIKVDGKITKRNKTNSELVASISNINGYIDTDLWLNVQLQFDKNRTSFPRLGKTHNALLVGKIFCGECNSHMIIQHGKYSKKLDKKLFYYLCSLKRKSKKQLCSNRNANTEEIERLVIDSLKNLYLDKNEYLKKIKKMLSSPLNEEDFNLKKLKIEKQIKEKNIQIENLVTKLSYAEDISDVIINKIKKLKEEINNLNNELINTDNYINSKSNSLANLELIESLLNECKEIDKLSRESQKRIIDILIDKIYWYGKDNRIKIIFYGAEVPSDINDEIGCSSVDTAHAKLMTTYYPLEKLRKIPGLEHAKYVDPYAGSKGNSMRYLSVAPRTNDMKVQGVDNLFCAGEKSGLFVGHTEAICTGTLAGHNSVRLALGLPLLILPSSIAIGDIISYENEQSKTRDGRKVRYTFAGAGYFKRMQELGLYTLNIKEIKNKVTKLNLDNIFNTKLC